MVDVEQVAQRMQATQFRPGTLGVKQFRGQNATNQLTTSGEESQLASFPVPTARGFLQGPQNPMKVALPAYESFTTDGTADNTETFSLSYDLIDCPNTGNLVLYEGGTKVSPDSVDVAGDSFDFTSTGTNTTLHVFYMVGDTANVVLKKVAPSGKAGAEEELYEAPMHHVNLQDQTDQPQYLSLQDDRFAPWVPKDFEVQLYVDATYPVALTDPDGDGAVAHNALFQIPAKKAQSEIPGLGAAIRESMGRQPGARQ